MCFAPTTDVEAPPSPAKAGDQVDISVIVVSWNARKHLDECLDTLSRGIKRRYEVIVVDNASTDGSAEMVARNYPWVRLIVNATNTGFARANNIGFNCARGHYWCLINSDVNVSAGCLDRLAAYLDAHESVGLVGPKILNADGSPQNTCRSFPSLRSKFCEVFGLARIFPKTRWLAAEEMRWFDYRTERPVDALVGCFIMARRAAVEDFGQLDESFFMYGEDIDWCWRCRRAGWEVAFVPEGRSIHYGGSSSANAPLRFSVELQRATVQWWTKHRGPVACLCLKACLFAQNLLRALREVVNAVVTRKWESAGKIRLQTQLSCLRHLLHSH